MKKLIRFAIIWLVASAPMAFCGDDVVMKAMHDELGRSVQQLHAPDVDKPYFVAYRVNDEQVTQVAATLGDLTSSNEERARVLFVDVRVGDYTFDNSNYLSRRNRGRVFAGTARLPLDDDYDQIRRAIWLATDREYKQSAEELSAKRSLMKNRNGGTELPDYTRQDPITLTLAPVAWKADRVALEKLARETSAVFRHSPDLLNSSVQINARNLYIRYVNSEGASFTRAMPIILVHVQASAQATDGQPINETFDLFLTSPDALHKEELIAGTKKVAERLHAKRTAKSLERYNGPVLFEGKAGAQAFAQVFAPAVIATRFPMSDDPQFESGMQQFLAQLGGPSLGDRIGGRVLPDGFDVIDKPRQDSLNGVPMFGTSPVDDEAVATHDYTIVDKGILKGLLATRTPSADAKTTTGSRHGIGAAPTNLFLTTRKGVPDAELRKQMMEIVKQRGLEYGVVVRDLGMLGLSWVARMGGASMMANRGLDSAGEVEAYRVYPDGHEELIRGAEFSPFLVSNFKEILAAGDKPVVYSGPFIPMVGTVLAGMGGASSPVGDAFGMASYVAPSLLFEEVGLKKNAAPAPNRPVVPSPVSDGK